MDSEYDRKFEEMKQYIPFLEDMIKRLETTPLSPNPRQAQLDKIRSLRGLLLDKKRMKMENLLKCEQVLLNLYSKVEQKDTLPGIKKASDRTEVFFPNTVKDSTDKPDLNSVRRKLQSVASKSNLLEEAKETLPGIARATEIEVVCAPGSKEPTLFQRRPNKSSKSPIHTLPSTKSIHPEKKSPQKPIPKRNYTRVLVSPDSSHMCWSTSEEPSDKPLFSRRSPRRSPRKISPSYHKKERKKSSTETKKQKHEDVNITLDVPEECLNSLNTKDILSRIINCSDGDVDIDTLRDIRKQILGELKHTGANEDISDLIIKSYKKKKPKNKNRNKKVEVEEGELSDSESEAIESIYGSLVLVDKDKSTSSEVQITEKEAQPRKIQICFVINSDKESPTTGSIDEKDKHLNPTATDICEFEMFDEENKSDEIKVISKKVPQKEEIKEKYDFKSETSVSAKQAVTTNNSNTRKELNQTTSPEIITIDDVSTKQPVTTEKSDTGKELNQTTSTEVITIDHVSTKQAVITEKSNIRQELNQITSPEVITIDDEEDVHLKIKDSEQPSENDVSRQRDNTVKIDISNNAPEAETISQMYDKTSNESTNRIPFKANFYKPLNEKESEENNETQLENKNVIFQIESNKPQVETNDHMKNLVNEITPSPSNKINITEVTVSVTKPIEAKSNTTENTKDKVKIPLLNLDPVVPEPPAKQVVSEIDILQALKNDILSESLLIPGTEGVTPALHQPTARKVANARELIRKKRISIEKYKEKSNTSSKHSFFKDSDMDIYMSKEEQSKRQSLKLTEKERERFNFAAKIALDNSSDEELNKEYSLDDIYGDLAPQSPEDNEIDRAGSTSPIIIPVDPIQTTMVNFNSDVDMRTLMPILSPSAPKPVPTLMSLNLVSPTRTENKHDQNYRPPPVDPRLKWELNKPFGIDSPNSQVMNPDRTPRPVVNYPNMTPSRTPCLTPNARTFEMTPHMQFELDDNPSKKHVYAPSFPIYERRDHREMSMNRENPHWEPNTETESRRKRWENSESRDRNHSRKWEGRDPRSTSAQRDIPSDHQRFRNNNQNDRNCSDRREDYSYSRLDCPQTPVHSFGRSDCPATPTPSLGRMETPMTPVHPFGRSDCPPTPSHPFGRLECPTTPSHPFGRSECPTTPSHPFGRSECPTTPSHHFGRSECPTTPSHPFGRSECPATPSHPFGRSECPLTPSHPFGRSDMNVAPMTPSHPFGRSDYPQNHSNTAQFVKDPRLNRSTEYESSSLNQDDRERGYYNDRRTSNVVRPYNTSDNYRHYGREQSIGRIDRQYDERSGPYNREQTSRREPSVGRFITRDYDNQLYSRDRGREKDYHYEAVTKSYHEVGSHRNFQRASSVGRTLTSNDNFNRSLSQTPSGGKNYRENKHHENKLSVKPQSGRSFTIDTSINRTFQEFLTEKGIQQLDYTFDTRRQRAASVGRSLTRETSVGRTYRESSVGRTLSIPSQPLHDTSEFRNKKNFVRARSMGREIVQNRQEKSFQDIKDDFKSYSANFKIQSANKKATVKSFNYVDPRTRKENREKQQQRHSFPVNTKQGYSPRKNNRDPRLRRDQHSDRDKYGAEENSRDKRNYGIVYSHDNITKGTILGSGYGVKNYKIPKIKRVTEEKEDTEKEMVINQKEKELTNERKIVEKKKDVTDNKEKNMKSGAIKSKYKIVNKKHDDGKPMLGNIPIKATTRNSKNDKVDSKFSEYGAAIKTRKQKKAVLFDLDLDSQENTVSDDSQLSSDNKATTITNKSTNTVQIDETNKKEDDLASLGIGDLDLFPDNLASDPVMDNINALIADLDNDIEGSKDGTSKQFTNEISLANMLERITSPSPTDSLKERTVEESLNDLNELINEDLNKSDPKSQDKPEELHFKEIQNKSDAKTKQDHKSDVSEQVQSVNLRLDDSQPVNKATAKNECTKNVQEIISNKRNELEKIPEKSNSGQEQPADFPINIKNSVFQTNILDKQKNKINVSNDYSREIIVSTTDTPKELLNKVEVKLVEQTDECHPNRSSTPDSTNKNVPVISCDIEMPDSTNEMQNEMHLDISSSHDSTQLTNKQIELLSNKVTASQMDTIGNLLSMLQDKSKIKELLSMFNDQSAGSEKIKKKLERLSEIVSDDEDTNTTTVEKAEVTLISAEVAASDIIEEKESTEANKTIDENERKEGASEQIEMSQRTNVSPKIIEQSNTEERGSEIIEENKTKERAPETIEECKSDGNAAIFKESKDKEERAIEINENKDETAPETILHLKSKNEEAPEATGDNKHLEKDSSQETKTTCEVAEILENKTGKKNKTNPEISKTEENNVSHKDSLKASEKDIEENMNKDNLKTLDKTEENDLSKPYTDDTGVESGSELSSITKPQTTRKRKNMLKRNKRGKGKKGKEKPGKEKRVTRSNAVILQQKPKKASRELKQLQDDIKEMFLSDDILNATGIRMCRIAKLVDEKTSTQDEESTIETDRPVVVLEKFRFKDAQNDLSTSSKTKKKLDTIQKVKASKSENSGNLESIMKKKTPKHKPGPKSKTMSLHQEPSETSEIDYDSISEKKLSDALATSSDSENESLASSRSFGSSEVFTELKKKPKRKRGKWKSGVIKPKKKKKVESKPADSSLDDNILVPQRPITIPDMNCFTDKTYCFLKNIFTYSCRLCNFSGNEIVHHYKRRHPHSEIPLSRMNSVIAKEAIEQCEEFNFQTISKIATDKYVCRFCFKEFSDKRKSNHLEVFFWHVVSTHTGEYKQLCSECINMTRCPFNLDIPPPPKDVKGQLIGYICGKCNFTQISLENLKTHVIVRHNDEQTEVYTINLAMMTKKTINALLKQSATMEQPRLLRSSRSTQSVTEASDDRSDITESTDRLSELDSVKRKSVKDLDSSSTDSRFNIQSKFTFENEDRSSNIEKDNKEVNKSTHFVDLPNPEHDEDDQVSNKKSKAVRHTESDDIVNCPHFKISYTNSGSKEYVCCINGKDNHYKTTLLISMKKHVQTKHPETWDGYCFICKVIVTTQGIHYFKECLQHLLDKHIDNFPVLERIVEPEEKPDDVPVEKTTERPTLEEPPKPYINVRPLAELLFKEIENLPADKTSVEMPRIQSVVSLDPATVLPLPSPTSPAAETPPLNNTASTSKFTQLRKKSPTPKEPYKYEEAQAQVMKQKHQVVLQSMMTHDKLVKIFKCAGRYCYFTSDNLEAALLHASTHQRIGGDNSLLCAYCDFDCSGNAIALVMHVFKNHGRCPFVCAHCFYRGAAGQLVRAHMTRVHGAECENDAVLKTDTVTPGTDDPDEMLSREDAVPYYNCADGDGSCKFKTYTPGKFSDHLLIKHKPPHLCFICSASVATPLDLVYHMRTHDFRVFQCTWCHHGADSEPELLAHASSRHPGKQPQAYLRVITTKDGTTKMMVLPMAQYNKSTILTELVPASTALENPVREAERSIELEKLIGSMAATIEPIASEKAPDAAQIQQESIRELGLVEEPRLVTPPPSLSAEHDLAAQLTPILKTEPQEETPVKNTQVTDIICLDSDEDSGDSRDSRDSRANVIDLSDDGTTAVNSTLPRLKELLEATKELPASLKELFSPPKNVASTSKDAISIPEDTLSTPKEDAVSPAKDDMSTPKYTLSPPKDSTSDPKVQRIPTKSLYKCPKCYNISKTLPAFKRHSHCFTSMSETVMCSHCTLILSNKQDFYKHLETDHKMPGPKELKDPTKDKQNATCGICEFRHRSLSFIKSHLRTEHGITNLVVASKYGDNGELLYTVRESPKPKPTPKRKLSAGNTESPAKRKRYGPYDVDLLPTKPILDELAYCSLCEFSSKVRLNLVRHLQGHADKQPVAQTVPVNPVPHLETNEKHFDKMLNLASSSIVTRVLDKPTRVESAPVVSLAIPPEAASRFPKFVPERQRLTCGAKGCSYISVDEAMLKFHWETLHAGTNEYHCVHCPPYQHLDTTRPLTASRIIAHMKMHDVRLYACSSCFYYHYRRQVVEKHLEEAHKDAVHIMVVREEFSAPAPGLTQPTTAPTMDLKPWQCGLCKFKSMLRQEVVEHCATIHSSKMQYKCSNCPFRTSTLENVTKHRSNSHPTSKEDVVYYYYREGSIPDEIDGTPRWMKQRQKMGIVDPEVKTEADASTTAGPPMSSTLAIDLNLVKQETEEPEAVESVEDLCKRFGQFCDANGLKFKCPLCNAIVEDTRDAMQSHLYEELKYRKWSCSICAYKAFHKTGLKEHMLTEHRQNRDPVQLPVNARVEKWVSELLNHQAALIEKTKENFAMQKMHNDKLPTSLPPEVRTEPKATPEPKVEELEEAFGPLGASIDTDFCCPKCDYRVKEEMTMRNHLETELNRIRWRCSNCANKFQEYHEAQLHCKSVHPGQSARPVEALRDPTKRAAWLAAVLRTQKLTMPIAEPQNDPIVEESVPSGIDNSLLVVRYEERVPTPEEEMLMRRSTGKPKPTQAATTPDSDEERLVIDESTEDKELKQRHDGRSCPHCEFTSKYASAVRDHVLRHYNLKPYTCGRCRFNCYVYQVGRHNESYHPGLPNKFSKTIVPDGPPTIKAFPKRGKQSSRSDVDYKPKEDVRKKDDLPKVICLVCELAVLESETQTHVHENITVQFAKKGDVVVKCCTCLTLALDVEAIQQHHSDSHPSVHVNYAYYKLQGETRDVQYCGHCFKGFKFIRDLRSHHNAVHFTLPLKLAQKANALPVTDIIDCDDDASTSKRKCEDTYPPMKKVARKSTTKLPSQCVAKKSTSKLPYYSENQKEYSYYGTKPTSIDEYANVTTLMPFCNTMMPFSVKKLSELIEITPSVIVKDYNK